MKVKVFAKLNITLNVGRKQGDYHSVNSVAVSVDVFDIVQVMPRADNEITVSGMQLPTNQNVAFKAAQSFSQTFGTSGVDVTITKGIAMGAGMGGSSADSAAVIYCMCKLFDIDLHSDAVHKLCASLGSDVYFMLFGGLGRLHGRGEQVEFGRLASPIYFALTTFDYSCSTGEVYRNFDQYSSNQVYADNGKVMYLLQQGKNKQALQCQNNFLQYAVAHTDSYADEYLLTVSQLGYRANMTGSGSAYYVAFDNKEQAQGLVQQLSAEGYSTTLCSTVASGIELV